jgi:probable DNA metabolism protein
MRDSQHIAYDGTFETLLLLVGNALRSGEARGTPWSYGADAPTLFDEPEREFPPIDPRAVAEAARYIRAFSALLFDLCLGTWMSEEGVEHVLLDLAAEAGCQGPEIVADYARPPVRVLRAACQRVDREVHRLEGLARFSLRRDGLYSSPLEPDHNVIAALVPHFARRFGSQAFALVDVRRALAYESRGGALSARMGSAALALLPDDPDENEVSLWRSYFDAADNPARRNPVLQRRLMPARYWKYLPELSR